MREHQIVITLKPDQFLEVQRLARAANAKSMGVFVRQQLLAALGIEGAGGAGGANQQVQAENLQAALGQIKRLHGELKTFVAESLSLYNVGLPASASDTEQFESAEQPVMPSLTQAADALEVVAERTFAISPRLGPIGQPSDDDGGRGPGRKAGNHAAVDPSGRQEPHRREQHRLHHAQMAASDILDVPYRTPDEQAAAMNDPLHKLLPADEPFNVQPAAQANREWGDVGNTDELADAGGSPAVPPSLAERLATAFYSIEEEAPFAPANAEASALGNFAADVDLDEDLTEEKEDIPEPAPELPARHQLKPKPGSPVAPPSLSGSPPPKRRQV